MGQGFTPYRRDVAWVPATAAFIRPLLDRLDPTRGVRNWGYGFRFGLLAITPDDFATIGRAMRADLGLDVESAGITPYVCINIDLGGAMPSLILIAIMGAAAGFLATRVMRVQTDVPTTVVIGIVGAVVGASILRFLVLVTGLAAYFVGSVLGAMVLIWAWRTYVSK